MAVRLKDVSNWFSYGITFIGVFVVVISLVWFLDPVSIFSYNGLVLTVIASIITYTLYHAKRFTDELKKIKK